MRVPASALFRHQGRWAVFVTRNGRARLRPLALGLMNDSHAEVKQGLQPGEEIVLFPSENVADGVKLARRGG